MDIMAVAFLELVWHMLINKFRVLNNAIWPVVCLVIFVFSQSSCAFIKEFTYNNPKPDEESRRNYVNSHPEFSKRLRGLILNGLSEEGMTKEQVRSSWGEPDTIKATSKYGADAEWYYWCSMSVHRTAYFKGDILIRTE
jgi:hypothetical protein